MRYSRLKAAARPSAGSPGEESAHGQPASPTDPPTRPSLRRLRALRSEAHTQAQRLHLRLRSTLADHRIQAAARLQEMARWLAASGQVDGEETDMVAHPADPRATPATPAPRTAAPRTRHLSGPIHEHTGRPVPVSAPVTPNLRRGFQEAQRLYEQEQQARQRARTPYPPTPYPPTAQPPDAGAGERERIVAELVLAARAARQRRDAEFAAHLRRGGLDEAIRYARDTAYALRRDTIDALCGGHRDPDRPWIEFEYELDDETGPIKRAKSYLELVTARMGLGIHPHLPSPAQQAEVQAAAQEDRANYPLYVWLAVPPNVAGLPPRRVEVMGRECTWRERPWMAFQWAALLGLWTFERAWLAGSTVGDFIFVPEAERDLNFTAVLHTFARTLLRFDYAHALPPCGPERAGGYGCQCDRVDAAINARPPEHAQMTGVLAPQRQPTPSVPLTSPQPPTVAPFGYPSGYPSGRPLSPQEMPIVTPSVTPTGSAGSAGPTAPSSRPSVPSLPRTLGQTAQRLAGSDLVVVDERGEIRRDIGTSDLARALGACEPGENHAVRPLPDGLSRDGLASAADEWGDEDDPAATREQHTPPGGMRREGR